METSTENQSKYVALGFTFGLHALLLFLLICIVFVKPVAVDENQDGCVLEWINGTVESSNAIDPKPSVLVSSSSVVTDPSEKSVFMKSDMNGKQDENFISENEQSTAELLNALSVIKGKKGKSPNETDSESDTPNGINDTRGRSILYDRTLLQEPDCLRDAVEEGVVVVEICVDEKGKVIKATPGQRGSTTLSANLYSKACQSALGLKFNPLKDAPKEQRGTYTFVFTLE